MPPCIGRPLRRIEDERLITGQGRFAGDINFERLVHIAFVRSTMPHARILGIDTSAAKSMPGVIAVWTADDLPEVAGGFGDRAPADMHFRARPILNRDEVNYAGEAFALVIAEDPYLAVDATEQVVPDIEPLPGVGGIANAIEPDAPVVHAGMPGNVARKLTIEYGEIAAAFGEHAITAAIRLTAARVAGAAMEPRATTATPDDETGGLKIWTSTQNVFGVRGAIAATLGLDQEKVRVLAEDVGGGFGAKGSPFAEEVLTALAAWRLKRPVRWVASRTEDTATTSQGHGSIIELEIAADRDGKIRGLRGSLLHDIGAYAGSGAYQPDNIIPHMMSAYVIPALHIDAEIVYTNSVPAGFIRGGGRPLGNYGIERVMDQLAVALDISPVELRRRNLVQPEQMPYATGYPMGRHGIVYNGGDYPKLLELALSTLGDVKPLERLAGDRLFGLGVACSVESSGFGRGEPARLEVRGDGIAHLHIGSTPQGQGHQTMAAQIVAERLGWPIERVKVTAGDTKHVPFAVLTAGSRTAIHVGNASAKAAGVMRRQLLERAGDVLEADVQDLVMEDGFIAVRGAPGKRVPAASVVPEEGLEVLETFDPDRPSAYASACHAAAVAVDPWTGQVEIMRYAIVHDVGRTINSLIVEGQMHGGLAHGVGYALYESAMYDPDGTFRTGSFLDYTIVSTGEMATVPVIAHIETAADSNTEGIKGAGESGTIPVPAAISSAVENAVRRSKPNAVIDAIPITSDRLVEILGS